MTDRLLIAAHQAGTLGVRSATVRQWARRGRLHARGLDRHGRPLYAVADVLALAKRDTRNRAVA